MSIFGEPVLYPLDAVIPAYSHSGESRNRKLRRRSDKQERSKARAIQPSPPSLKNELKKKTKRTPSRDRGSRSVKAEKRNRDYTTPTATQRQIWREKKRHQRPSVKQKRSRAKSSVAARKPYSAPERDNHRSSRHMSKKRAKARPERKVAKKRVEKRPKTNLVKGDQKRGRQARDRKERQVRSRSRNLDNTIGQRRHQKQDRQKEGLMSMKGKRKKRSR